MNKKLGFFAGVIASAALAFGAFALSGCAQKQTVDGDYHYATEYLIYGVKVKVEVQTDGKGDRIRKVTLADSDYTVTTSEEYGFDGERDWNNGLQGLLNAYRGMYVVDVLSKEAATDPTGAPYAKDPGSFVDFGDNVIITGATQSSARLFLAVQNALKNFGGYKTATGEFKYDTPYGAYGAKVNVVVKGDVIKKVVYLPCDYTITSDYDGKPTWDSGKSAILKAYEGKKVSDILSKQVACQDSSAPSAPIVSGSDGFVDFGSEFIVTGATQSSARLMLAVKNALENL